MNTNTNNQIIKQIINLHTILFVNSSYMIIDPESKLYNVDVLGRERSQEEILDSISNPDAEYNFIDFKYNEELELRYEFKDNNISLIPLDINSVHLIRLIGLKKIPTYNLELEIQIESVYLPDILVEINLMLDKKNSFTITDYCTICGDILNIKGLEKVQCCNKSQCICESKIKVLDNRVVDMYLKDPNVTEFLILVLITGTSHPKQEKIFKPLPKLPQINNLEKLITILNEENKKGNLDIINIKNSKSDIELYKMIGPFAYGIINNAISDNYFSMNTIKKFSTEIMNIQKIRLIEHESIFDKEGIKFIRFNYSYEIENDFKKENYLFHGTPLHSWYPIVKNGLKVMSGTEFQTNGAAYGNGIYFSDSFKFSLGYSYRGIKEKNAVGIFEINDNIELYKKTTNIYVVNNDKIMLLRYLVIIEKNFTGNYQEITDYFTKYIGGINKLNEKKFIGIKNKRLSGEIKLLDSNVNVLNVEIIDESKHWVVELKDIKGKKIKLIIYFNDYPRLPPKIIIDSDIGKKIISDDPNNLMLPELNPSKWDVTLNLSKIVDKIYNCIGNTI
jgi:hypothetical protein